MIPDIFEVTKIGAGILHVMPRPSADWLEDDIKYFQKLNINSVVSLLEEFEEYKLGLTNEKELMNEAGIEFVSFPVQDRGLPNPELFKQLVIELHNQVNNGRNIAIHCRAGIGRTGVLSSCLLIQDGYDAQTAIDMVSASRGVPIPDTQEQFDFICNFNNK